MLGINELKNGMTIFIDGEIYFVVSFEHVKPGKGGAFVRTRLKSLKSGNLIEKTFRSGEKIEQAFLEERKIQFLYRKSDLFHFMDQSTFEEVELSEEQLKDKVRFLKENMVLSIAVCQGAIVEINLPNFVELQVAQTEPGMRADTVKQTTKTAVLESGAEVSVPLFINKGDIIKIDTRTGEYIGRV